MHACIRALLQCEWASMRVLAVWPPGVTSPAPTPSEQRRSDRRAEELRKGDARVWSTCRELESSENKGC
eukprot:9652283-Lingulodinium_polyedra.AAC.1